MKNVAKIILFYAITALVISCSSNPNQQVNTGDSEVTIQQQKTAKQKAVATNMDSVKVNQKTAKKNILLFEPPKIAKPSNKTFTLSKDSARAIMQTRAAKKWADEFNEFTKSAKRQTQSAPIIRQREAISKKNDEGK